MKLQDEHATLSKALQKSENEHDGATAGWLQDTTPEYDEFARDFVSPHTSVFHGKMHVPQGADTFGEHVRLKDNTPASNPLEQVPAK